MEVLQTLINKLKVSYTLLNKLKSNNLKSIPHINFIKFIVKNMKRTIPINND